MNDIQKGPAGGEEERLPEAFQLGTDTSAETPHELPGPGPIPPDRQPSPPRKRRFTGSTTVKAAAFILTIVMILLAAASVVGSVLIVEEGLYTISRDEYKERVFSDRMQNDAYNIVVNLMSGETDGAYTRCSNRNIALVQVTSEGSSWSYNAGTPGSWHLQTFIREAGVDHHVEITLTDTFEKDDIYSQMDRLVDLAYALRYSIYAIGGTALLLTVVCFVFLMCASGHRRDTDEIYPGWGTAIPFDLLTAMLALGWTIAWALVVDMSYSWSDATIALIMCVAVPGMLITLIGWSMSLALRVKLGGLWKNTVIYRLLMWLWKLAKRLFRWLWQGVRTLCRWLLRVLRGLWRGLASIPGGLISLVGRLPLIWKTALGTLFVAGVELIALLMCWYEPDVQLFLWFLEKLVLVPAVFYFALTMRKLQKAGEALAAGDLSYQTDTRRMLWSFKAHGENLNSIALGTNKAVEQRLKSERLKTELITNVSHDLKTPLTSIINYADLIGKEPGDRGKVEEYSEVLLRQSERLKKLLEDLVEASKASTGNFEVMLAPCEAGVMLTQAAGEYQQRLEAAGLELICRQPDHPVVIMADGRRLWRVFDNLMNNICKYAQYGTRVYLTLEEQGGEALISFKNTSHSALDIPAEELLERFTRGDTSRSSEGNGLGLSIAQSLTELQKGRLELTVDADLFKVALRFPLVQH